MIKPDLSHCKDLKEFYKEICREQAEAHGKEYIAHHKALIKCVKDPDVNMVKELGVCQGGTLAAMMLQNPYQLTGYDIAPDIMHHMHTYLKSTQKSKVLYITMF